LWNLRLLAAGCPTIFRRCSSAVLLSTVPYCVVPGNKIARSLRSFFSCWIHPYLFSWRLRTFQVQTTLPALKGIKAAGKKKIETLPRSLMDEISCFYYCDQLNKGNMFKEKEYPHQYNNDPVFARANNGCQPRTTSSLNTKLYCPENFLRQSAPRRGTYEFNTYNCADSHCDSAIPMGVCEMEVTETFENDIRSPSPMQCNGCVSPETPMNTTKFGSAQTCNYNISGNVPKTTKRSRDEWDCQLQYKKQRTQSRSPVDVKSHDSMRLQFFVDQSRAQFVGQSEPLYTDRFDRMDHFSTGEQQPMYIS